MIRVGSELLNTIPRLMPWRWVVSVCIPRTKNSNILMPHADLWYKQKGNIFNSMSLAVVDSHIYFSHRLSERYIFKGEPSVWRENTPVKIEFARPDTDNCPNTFLRLLDNNDHPLFTLRLSIALFNTIPWRFHVISRRQCKYLVTSNIRNDTTTYVSAAWGLFNSLSFLSTLTLFRCWLFLNFNSLQIILIRYFCIVKSKIETKFCIIFKISQKPKNFSKSINNYNICEILFSY